MIDIKELIEGRKFKSERRGYLGASILGRECWREIWFNFRWCTQENLTAQKRRLLDRGHQEELVVFSELKDIGIEVFDDQKEIIFCHDHSQGHIDGKYFDKNLNDNVLLEIKTANTKNFNHIKKHGCFKSKPEYYVQTQLYMKFEELNLALLIVTCKNTDERYYEFIRFDENLANEYVDKGERIVESETFLVFPKLGGPKFYKCSWCIHHDLCQLKSRLPDRTCRTCVYADLLDHGKWECSANLKPLDEEKQLKSCDGYNILKCFV